MDFTGYEDLNLVGYLYNTCFGGFAFSDEFEEEYNIRRLAAGLEPTQYLQERKDPTVISLFQEMGPERSSGTCAKLKLYWAPAEFLKYVDHSEYDGKEHVVLAHNDIYADILKNFLEDWKQNPSLTVEDLNTRFTTAVRKLGRYREFLREVYWKRPESNQNT